MNDPFNTSENEDTGNEAFKQTESPEFPEISEVNLKKVKIRSKPSFMYSKTGDLDAENERKFI